MKLTRKKMKSYKLQEQYTKADIDKARATAASDSRDTSQDIAKIPEGPKLIQALGDALADMIMPNSSTHEERNPKDFMAHILSDPLNSGTAGGSHPSALTTMLRSWRTFSTDIPVVDPAFLEKHQEEIIRIAQKSPKNRANQHELSMDEFKFQYPSTAFKNKAAELLDAMEIDMLDNFDDYDDWVEHGSDSPNREVEDITDELLKLDPTKGEEVDDWMEHVAFPYIKKNNSVNEGIFTRTRLMRLAGLKNK